jgi:hypothetical protein
VALGLVLLDWLGLVGRVLVRFFRMDREGGRRTTTTDALVFLAGVTCPEATTVLGLLCVAGHVGLRESVTLVAIAAFGHCQWLGLSQRVWWYSR